MLNLHHATRLYTDIELLKKFAKFIHANGIQGERLDEVVLMMSIVMVYDGDVIKGFVSRVIKDLEK
jgi:hypothetical protein